MDIRVCTRQVLVFPEYALGHSNPSRRIFGGYVLVLAECYCLKKVTVDNNYPMIANECVLLLINLELFIFAQKKPQYLVYKFETLQYVEHKNLAIIC